MKYEDLRFTEKQVRRILAEATEREARDHEEHRTISYSQLVQIAQESMIDPKYLKVSTKQLVKEAGGLEKATIGKMYERVKDFSKNIFEGFFFFPKAAIDIHKHDGNLSVYQIGKMLVGVLGNALSIPGYAYLFEQDSKIAIPVLAIHLGTNITNGFYEWYRYEKSKFLKEMNGNEKTE